MSARRGLGNRIRGPQSALTDFLASNNISAAQISADYQRRQAEAEQQVNQDAAEQGEAGEDKENENEEDEAAQEQVEAIARKKKKKREQEKSLAKIKADKKSGGGKKRKRGHTDDEDDDSNDDDAENLFGTYAKKKPMPGQLENCELCSKRFTVTPYSKTGPAGGLLCRDCSKKQETSRAKDEKAKKASVQKDRRRKTQSNLLDGVVQIGSKSLSELCVSIVADNITDIDELGDLPPKLLNRLSQILSKKRVLNSRTLNLFLRPDFDTIDVYDCGKLETEDYITMFSVVPRVQKVNLRHCSQIRDNVFDYIMERDVPITHLQLEAPNLISSEKWTEYLKHSGHRLEELKIAWLDGTFLDANVEAIADFCPNLKRLKIKKCTRLGNDSLSAIARLHNLEHLSLQLTASVISSSTLVDLIAAVGKDLKTLSLEDFTDAEDDVLATIHSTCRNLAKLRFTNNDICGDAAYADLFRKWNNSPLTFIDLSGTRHIDNNQPSGPETAIGLASAGFEALLDHSGSTLVHLDVASCRHIPRDAFEKSIITTPAVAASQPATKKRGKPSSSQSQSEAPTLKSYPHLQDLNVSFVPGLDTTILAGLFRAAPALRKITAFACFSLTDVIVPPGVALIGLPNAQDSIVRDGGGFVDFGD